MQERDNNKDSNNLDDEIDLQELFYVLLQGRKIIFYITILLSTIGIIYSLLLPNIYKSESLLAPVEESSKLEGALSGYSSLAGLAGISLPTGDEDSNSVKAIEMMNSLSFFENNFMPRIFLPNLMAVESWDYEKNEIIYDPSIFDENSKTWVRDYSYPKKQIPSAQESFEVFKDEHFSLSEDKKTGFINLAVKHQSPFIAKKWVEIIVKEVNTFYRQKDKSDSQKAVLYLNDQMSKNSFSEIKEVTADLLQREIQKLTLIEVNESYVFEYIYPPAVMEKKSEPSRSLIVTLFAFLGLIISIFIVLIRHYLFLKGEGLTERIGS